jgi:hypothetical protein
MGLGNAYLDHYRTKILRDTGVLMNQTFLKLFFNSKLKKLKSFAIKIENKLQYSGPNFLFKRFFSYQVKHTLLITY